MTPQFTVLFYINNTLQKQIDNLSAQDAYLEAAPKEAYDCSSKNSWHLMLRHPAIPRMNLLLVGETIRIAWQDLQPSETQHILVQRIS